MSDDTDDKTPPRSDVGYGRPPVEHQFKKGERRNPAGRPPKRERSLIPRQLRNDILKVKETAVRVNTAHGPKTLTTFEATLIALAKKAMSGHLPSIRLYIEKCELAVQQHFDAHVEFKLLEDMEKRAVVTDPDPETLRALNRYRRGTRKT